MKKFLTLAVLFFLYTLQAQVNLSSSLTACYPLAGNANDQIGISHGISYNVATVLGSNSAPASAIAFSGTPSSYIELPDVPELKPLNAVSFSGWVMVNGYQADDHIVFTRNNSNSSFAAYSLITYFSNGAYHFRSYKENGPASFYAESTTTVALNTWYHLVFATDNNAIQLYVNGVLEATAPVSIPFAYVPGKGVILGGCNEMIYNTPFLGEIDNVRFYNRVINSAEVSALYQQNPECITTILPPVSNFSVSASNICAGQPITLTDLSTNSPTSWSWQLPGSTPVGTLVNNPVCVYNTPGTYTVTLVASNSAGASNNIASLVIHVKPSPVVTVAGPSQSVCAKSNVTLTASGASTYTWSSTQKTPSIVFQATATTVYTVTGSTSNGCKSNATYTVDVKTCTGLDSYSFSGIHIWPNPAQDLLEIETGVSQAVNLSLYDLLGNKVMDLRVISHASVDISTLQSGIYFLKGENANVTRVVKQ